MANLTCDRNDIEHPRHLRVTKMTPHHTFALRQWPLVKRRHYWSLPEALVRGTVESQHSRLRNTNTTYPTALNIHKQRATITITNLVNIIAQAHQSAQSAVVKNQQELVAQKWATTQVPIMNAGMVRTTIEEEQAAQEPPVSSVRVSHSWKRRWGINEPQLSDEPIVLQELWSGELLRHRNTLDGRPN